MRWKDEGRAKQAERIKMWKPWLKSTGPKTEEGKSVSSMNAFKTGVHSADLRELEAVFKELID